jgi:hypothetical protein
MQATHHGQIHRGAWGVTAVSIDFGVPAIAIGAPGGVWDNQPFVWQTASHRLGH